MSTQHPTPLGDSSMSQNPGDAATAPNASSLSLDKFWSLPEELGSRIVTLACRSTTSSSSGATGTSVDVATARALALTSPALSQQANAMLWKAIKITRPTALISLWEAVATRPELGLRVQHLYVGNDSNTPKLHHPHEWQISVAEGYLGDDPFGPCICSAFRWAEGRAGMRRGSTPQKRRTICERDRICMLKAILRALQEIQRALDIDLTQLLDPSSGSKLYEAQAAHELYLCHLQDVENAAQCGSQCDHKDCYRYPSLILAGFDTNTTMPPLTRQDRFDPNDKEWVLTREQVLDFICQPASPSDKFDYPLRLDCSHFDSATLKVVGGPLARPRPLRRQSEDGDINTSAEVYQDGQLVRLPWYDGTSLSAVQCLLALTPKLKNLALTDSLSCALDGAEAGRPKSLRTLSLSAMRGPVHFATMPSLEDVTEVEHLHICGFPSWPQILTNVNGLERLKELRWTMTSRFPPQEIRFFGVILDAFVGRQGTAADEAAAAAALVASIMEWDPDGAKALKELAQLRVRCFGAAEQEARADAELVNVSQRITDRLVEVKLRPDILEEMLKRASSAAERAAWIGGQPLRSQGRRLLLSASPADPRSAEGDDKMRKWMYEEVQEWWERHCEL